MQQSQNSLRISRIAFGKGRKRDIALLPGWFFLFCINPDFAGDEKTHYYFYEAARKTMNVPKINKKFRSNFHYVVKQKLHREHYGVNRIRAVLIESIDSDWANHLRINARHPFVLESKASPLFWFTTSELFESKVSGKEKELPLYLKTPEVVLRSIWATPEHGDNITQGEFLSLIPS